MNKKVNPTELQERILESLSYYFEDYDSFSCTTFKEAYETIKDFDDRIVITESGNIFIDDKLIYTNGSISPYAPKFSDIPEEFKSAYQEDLMFFDIYED